MRDLNYHFFGVWNIVLILAIVIILYALKLIAKLLYINQSIIMSKFKENKFYFYQIVPVISDTDENSIKFYKKRFKKAFQFNKQNLEVETSEGSISALEVDVDKENFITGALVYTLESNLLPRYDPNKKKTASIDLDGFRGLGVDCAYIYDPNSMVFILENRKPGVSLNAVRELLFRQDNNLPGFEYKAICYKNSYEKFLKSGGVKSMKMKMLRIPEKSDTRIKVESIKNTKDTIDELKGSHITIEVSSGREKSKWLDFDAVRKWADSITKMTNTQHEIEKFELKIEDVDSEKIVPIDLITGRIYEVTKIEKVRLINRFSIVDKISQMKKHYLIKKDIIDQFINE